jgi:tetratricopeptide (TPR) repeat protein
MALEETLKMIDEDLPQEITNDDEKKKCLTAIEQLDALAKTHTKNAQIYNISGKIYIRLQLFSKAESAFKDALAFCGEADPEILFQYGHLQNLTKNTKDAIKYFNQCLALSHDKHPKAHNNLCVSYSRLKDHDKALKHICLANTTEPK